MEPGSLTCRAPPRRDDPPDAASSVGNRTRGRDRRVRVEAKGDRAVSVPLAAGRDPRPRTPTRVGKRTRRRRAGIGRRTNSTPRRKSNPSRQFLPATRAHRGAPGLIQAASEAAPRRADDARSTRTRPPTRRTQRPASSARPPRRNQPDAPAHRPGAPAAEQQASRAEIPNSTSICGDGARRTGRRSGGRSVT